MAATVGESPAGTGQLRRRPEPPPKPELRICESSASGGHPRVGVSYRLISHGGERLGHPANVDSVVGDSGAQVCVMPLQLFVDLALPGLLLKPSSCPIEAENGARLDVVGLRVFVPNSFGGHRVHK